MQIASSQISTPRKARWNQLPCSRALPQLYSRALEHLAADESGAWPRQRLGELLRGLRRASAGGALAIPQHATLAEVYTRRAPLCACYGALSVRLTPLADVVLSDAAIVEPGVPGAAPRAMCGGHASLGRSSWRRGGARRR